MNFRRIEPNFRAHYLNDKLRSICEYIDNKMYYDAY